MRERVRGPAVALRALAGKLGDEVPGMQGASEATRPRERSEPCLSAFQWRRGERESE